MEKNRLIYLLKLIKYNKCPDVNVCNDGCILAEKYQPCARNSDDTRNRAIEMLQEELMCVGKYNNEAEALPMIDVSSSLLTWNDILNDFYIEHDKQM